MEADSQFGREINALETRLLSKLRIPSVTTTYNPGDALQRDEELDGREARTLVSKVYVPEYGRELIVKIERRREDFDKICHEAFIGLYGTNALNRLTPNFAMIYNYQLGFHCPSELPSGVDLCSKVYYEYIDGVPFEKFIRTCTLADYKAILIELFLALAYANETIGYLHMDLHGWNVIIRTLDTAEAIYFDQDPVAVTRFRPVIIDYAASVIRRQSTGLVCSPRVMTILRYTHAPWTHDIRSILEITSQFDFSDLNDTLIAIKGEIEQIAAFPEWSESLQILYRRQSEITRSIELVRQNRSLHIDNAEKLKLSQRLGEVISGTQAEFILAALPYLT